eukprot:TRINITY_DN846_c0_g1_i11.p1 TRINITY_DN846_c0_g1~~TRINITY_DN846_c0_g1_i11.p1  ORF type:complete len:242 (+),score=32.33 TRINITY_DN846_c0_g1_i11:81-806(+)
MVGGVREIVVAMRDALTACDSDLATSACSALRCFTSSNQENRLDAGREGAIECIAEALSQSNLKDVKAFVVTAVQTIANMCKDCPDNARRMEGAIGVVVAVMRASPKWGPTLIEAIRAINDACFLHRPNFATLVRESGVQAVVEAMWANISNKHLLAYACICLTNLCRVRENVEAVRRCGVVEVVTRVLTTHASDCDLTHIALDTLQSLSPFSQDDTNKVTTALKYVASTNPIFKGCTPTP